MSIHQRIKERRIAMGFSSHKALGEAVGVTWQTIQQWEKEGGTAPNRNRIEKVAEVLKVTPEYLLRGGDAPGDAAKAMEAADKRTAEIYKLQPVNDREAYLLHLFRRTDARGKDDMIIHGERLPDVFRPDIADNQS